LADAIQTAWNGADYNARFVVLTGGEPALQYDGELHRALKARSFYISIETNGTVPIRAPVDWKCVSPKAGTAILHNTAHELKFVYPQEMTPDEALKVVSADYQTLMPMDGLNLRENTAAAAQYVMDHPCWRLGHQLHKTIGLP
jgi:organic radical activating enzyme